ncbi:glyoxalase/bleomycin resistance protein/dioxygenase superfamily protein [Novosphingobium sp. PhB165]|uniref:VOC family protein n=1 Tax=Novosphingobium sp. PhB165 TaxID=2485105 RepID=UPI0010498BAD|nr:VOC family protein [Novosphingobium sp. PhB165]TCM16090.1 glyoxalase/bleomycin resistance protein/dioxygenase superfamily protein [Novosphingobium sp. PhB165]
MDFKLARQGGTFDTGSGLLRAEHFQMAYATNDIESAREFFAEGLGIREFRRLEGPLAAGGYIKADLAWVGSIMYELIEATGPGSAIYMSRQPAGEGVKIWHHHLGFLIHDQEQWDGVMRQAELNGWDIPYRSSNPLLDACFVDVPQLGHYLEYLFANPTGIAFFESVPRQ